MTDTGASRPSLTIVIPMYKSEATIGELVNALSALEVEGGLEIVMVNDGSPDSSAEVCRSLMKTAAVPMTLVEHTRNFGEHNAVMSGLRHARGDYVITMDDDLQNPPHAVVQLYDHARLGGWDVVYTRYKTKQHSYWRNAGSNFANAVADALLPKPKGIYLSSFRCTSSVVVEQVIKYSGPFPYVDGLISQISTNISSIEVDHYPRKDGSSGYTISKLVELWLSMATGFSLTPLRLSMIFGFISSMVGLTTIFCSFLFDSIEINIIIALFGLNFIAFAMIAVFIGIVGEYVGRTLLLSAGKPQAVVRSVEVSDIGSKVQ